MTTTMVRPALKATGLRKSFGEKRRSTAST
jgi:hypothetical protein